MGLINDNLAQEWRFLSPIPKMMPLGKSINDYSHGVFQVYFVLLHHSLLFLVGDPLAHFSEYIH